MNTQALLTGTLAVTASADVISLAGNRYTGTAISEGNFILNAPLTSSKARSTTTVFLSCFQPMNPTWRRNPRLLRLVPELAGQHFAICVTKHYLQSAALALRAAGFN